MQIGCNCPTCGQALIIVELDGIEVDHCVNCHGTWFDSGELELLIERCGAQQGQLHRALSGARGGSVMKRRCPRCRRRMRSLSLAGAPAITIDSCRAGQGLWLDSASLAALVSVFSSGPDAALATFMKSLVGHHLGQTGSGESS